MELGHTHRRDIDSQTMRMLSIHPDTNSTLENTDTKQEPFHNGSDSSKLSENMQHVDDITNTFDVKTEVIDSDHYQHMDIHYTHDMCSNSNYIDSGMIHDAHVPHVKSEADDEPFETHDQNEFIIEIDTCKDEYYDALHNNHGDVNLEEGAVEQEPGENCVTKEDMHMKHSDTQQQRRILHTSVDTKPCTVVVRDIRYTYPETVNHGFVLIHDAAPTVPIHTQPIFINGYDKPPQAQFTECGAGFRKNSSLKMHMLIHTGEKPHKCSICEVSFNVKGDLTRHIRTHTGDRPYKCSVCGVGFTQNHSLKIHKRIHTGDKPHTCSVCEVSFTQKSNLTRHMRMHTGEKPYKCTVCGVGFSGKSTWTRHMRTHTGEKPHKYTGCGVRFARAHNLKCHTLTHTGERSHKCTVCGVGFAMKNHLTYHIRTHTGEKLYKCLVCGREFAQKQQLKIHTRIHTGEKPHKCSVCEVSFAQKGTLTRHMETHTGENPYTCSVCGVRFTHKHHLKRHTRLHTGEKSHKCSVCSQRKVV